MFLISEAFRSLNERQWRSWDWRTTSILYVSWDWDNGPEAIAGRRLVASLLDAGARVHVLSAMGPGENLPSPNYDVTVAPHAPVSDNRIVRTWQMMRSSIPEPAGLWVSAAVAAGVNLLTSLPADTIIYGRTMPGASNIVAWHLARLTGRPWVAHFSDPWPPLQVTWKRWNWLAAYKWPSFHFWRRRFLADADALTFTNPFQAPLLSGAIVRAICTNRSWSRTFLLRACGSIGHHRLTCFTSCIPETSIRSEGTTRRRSCRGFECSLTGRRQHTVESVSLRPVGPMPTCPNGHRDAGLTDVVRMVGRLSQDEVEVVARQREPPGRGGLCNREQSCSGFQAARLHSGETPRSSRSPRRSSAMGRLFNEDGVGLTASYGSPEEVANRIGLVFDAWRTHGLGAFLPKPAASESFTQQRVLSELAGAFSVARRRRIVSSDDATHALPLVGERSTL